MRISAILAACCIFFIFLAFPTLPAPPFIREGKLQRYVYSKANGA